MISGLTTQYLDNQLGAHPKEASFLPSQQSLVACISSSRSGPHEPDGVSWRDPVNLAIKPLKP